MLSIRYLFEDQEEQFDREDMERYFEDRTNYHISLVNKYLDRIIAAKDPRIDLAVVKQEKEIHDESKFEEPECEPYVYITYKYYLKDQGVDKPNFNKSIERNMLQAIFHHVKNNKHHPEYWDNKLTIDLIKERDGVPIYIIDATKMPLSYVACMVADWCATSEERGTSPFDWADKNVNRKWKFTQEQIDFIYDLLNKIWRS